MEQKKRSRGKPRKFPDSPLIHITATIRPTTKSELDRIAKALDVSRGEVIDRLTAAQTLV